MTARRQAMAALRERAERVEREPEARAGRVRAQERARIARDMHDVVAHRISLVVLRAGALGINAPDGRADAGMDGMAALTEINRGPAPPRVVMLTTFDRDEYVHAALRAGAAGFLLKDTAPRDLIAAVRAVAGGGAMLSPAVTRRLIDAFAGREEAPDARAARARLAVLTGRERQVVRAVARGLSNAEIAREPAMSETTVKAHVSRWLTKPGRPTGCRSPCSSVMPARRGP